MDENVNDTGKMAVVGNEGGGQVPIAFQLDMNFNRLRHWMKRFSRAVMIVDDHGVILDVNNPFQRLVQLKNHEIKGKSYMQFLTIPEKLELGRKNVQWLKGKLRCGDANMIKTEIQMLAGNDEHRSYHVLTFYPVTPYETIAAQLISNIHLGIVLLDHCQKVIEINQAASEYLGIERVSALGRTLPEIFAETGDGQPDADRLCSFYSLQEERRWVEVKWKGKGITRNLSMTAHPVCDRDQECKGYYLIIENVTEVRALEKQVRRNNRLATIGQIAAGTAHEIRNPLTSIKGFLQVIGHKLRENNQLKEHGYIEIMQREISRISNLVGEFLLLSKPRDVHLRTVNVCQVLKEILPLIKNEALLHNVTVNIERRLSSLPMVIADGELLKQVFLNLCKNAIEAMRDGGLLTIRLGLQEPENKFVVDIVDAGPGIPSHVLEQIFDPFFTTKENGTGLGLPICKQILNEFGGRIDVTSDEMGTTFHVHLPLV
ncbi:ATP-binding protein [Paenactinomyces guangxiensis]|uniref:histidine kinase n=1 Tax=Paenactinomyces guangxiensis TaxID=1490290 RepID=A0A7W1WU77_9BACL|nr:ATP-binding protein [Paenactinomyces guangxiensis]MBA4496131.1 PAS domain-containing protein [Paenactinomyces guangxiensis]MBH8593219.1 PAS domain-containing protein [Paenactinomyces guangxiensis]